jgi:hypothetical protein
LRLVGGHGVGGGSGGKQGLPARVQTVPEEGVPDSALDDDIDGATQQPAEIVLQAKEVFDVLGGRERIELDDDIEIAGRWIKSRPGGRAKDIEPTHMAASTDRLDRKAERFD